jgi:hypothetical protein
MTLEERLETAFLEARAELHSDLKHGFPVRNNHTFWNRVAVLFRETANE